jgi:hypothetical protein
MLNALTSTLSVYRNSLIAVLLLALLAFTLTQHVQLGNSALKLEAAASENKALQSKIDALQLGVAQLQVEATRVKEAGVVAVADGKKLIAKAEARAVKIEQGATPADCEAAISFIVDDAGASQ